VAKISRCSEIVDERQRYSRFVASSLRVGDFAPEMDHVLHGGGDSGGIFYSVAPGDRSLLEVIKSDLGLACATVRKLRDVEAPWLNAVPTETLDVGVLRGWLFGEEVDSILDSELGIDWRSFESRRVMIARARQHGDLHPGNIMVKDDGSPALIDFGRVGRYSAAVDPIALEMSLLFHPHTKALLDGWNPLGNVDKWWDVHAFTADCPIADFIMACRAWAEEVSSCRREWICVGYAVASRQLKFRDTDHGLAARIVKAAIEAYDK